MKLSLNLFQKKKNATTHSKVSNTVVDNAVKNNLKKFSKTYKLLEEYDKNPSQPPTVSPRSSALREYIRKS